MKDIIGIGSSFVDYFFEVDKAFLQKNDLDAEQSHAITPKEFEQIFSQMPTLSKSPGGSTLLTLVPLAKLEVLVTYVGVVGDDEDGNFWFTHLPSFDKDIQRIGETGRSACLLTNNRKNRSFLYTLNEKENSFFENIDYKKLNECQYLHITPFYTDFKKSYEYLIELVNNIEKPLISFCPALVYASLGLKTLSPILKKTHVIFFSQEELHVLFDNVEKGSKELLQYGPKIVVCTLGEKGALITTKEKQFISPGKKVKHIIDPTGAGDAFAAGFLYGLLQNKSLEWSANVANSIAAQAITDFGLSWLERFDKKVKLL